MMSRYAFPTNKVCLAVPLLLILAGNAMGLVAPEGSYVFKDASGTTIAYFSEEGDFFTIGEIVPDSESLWFTENPEFVVKCDGCNVARLDSVTGDLHLKGGLFPQPSQHFPVPSPAFIVRDSSETEVAAIDCGGNLYIRNWFTPEPHTILALCWIDESSPYQSSYIYDMELEWYLTLRTSSLPYFYIFSGCLVPDDGTPQTVADVLPDGYSAPAEPLVITTPRFPTLEDIQDSFEEVADGMAPQNVILIFDSSGSMSDWDSSGDLDEVMEDFREWLAEVYPGINIYPPHTMFDPILYYSWNGEDWLAMLKTKIEYVISQY